MSNFTGVTFAQQKVLPSDDAIIRRKILSDGVLYGCELTYSGSTLTMSAGQLLICGRQIRHPAAQNWAISDATSGFARLVLTVDLTRTATKDTFDQVPDTIQYATSKDGFPELNQADVNTTGSVYQIAACVVSLGSGGITGIVDSIGPCEVSGGGGLNFKVVGGLTQPAGLAENDIWVITDFEITGYDFNATQPTAPVEGMVWIYIGTESPAAFNALKKNCITVYPLSAMQYISGAWEKKEAKSYHNGVLVNWIRYLYSYGDEHNTVTGGFTNNFHAWANEPKALTKNADNLSPNYYGGGFGTVKKINVAGHKTLTVVATASNAAGDAKCVFGLSTKTGQHSVDAPQSFFSAYTTIGTGTKQEYKLDISALSGEFYVGFVTYNRYLNVYEIKLS